MSAMRVASAVMVLVLWTVCAFGITVGGTVSGYWPVEDSPYFVESDLTIPAGETLTIEDGVIVQFMGVYGLNVSGTLHAVGLEAVGIFFTASSDDVPQGWKGMRFEPSASGSVLDYCTVERARTYETSWPEDCGGAVKCWYSSPRFLHCTFRDNGSESGAGGAIWMYYGGPLISHCLFYRNACDTDGGAIGVDHGWPLISNCTIVANSARHPMSQGGAGVRSWESTPTVVNTIIWLNTAPVRPGLSGAAFVSYSDVQDPLQGETNLNVDPQFVSAMQYDYRLLPASPCIDAGDPNGPLDSDGSVADMGALSYAQNLLPVQSPPAAQRYVLEQNFPNPFNATTTIRFNVPVSSRVKINLYNALGQLVRTMIDSDLDSGSHSVTLDASDLASGVYICTLETGSIKAASQKMLLVK